MATKTKKKGVVESAVEAAEELGQAATAFKVSLSHIKKAREKGSPATRAATRAGKATVRAAKRALPAKTKSKKKK